MKRKWYVPMTKRLSSMFDSLSSLSNLSSVSDLQSIAGLEPCICIYLFSFGVNPFGVNLGISAREDSDDGIYKLFLIRSILSVILLSNFPGGSFSIVINGQQYYGLFKLFGGNTCCRENIKFTEKRGGTSWHTKYKK